MITVTDYLAFTVDDDYDREMASPGPSRFGVYLRQQADAFRDCEAADSAVRFALTAWRIAQSPIMAPGYVRWHPRVQENVEHWDDDGRVALTIEVAAPLPVVLSRLAVCRSWRDWERIGDRQHWVEPYDNDRAAAFTTLFIRVPIQPSLLPTPKFQQDIPSISTAKQAVRSLCRIANTAVEPILAALDTT